MRYVRELGVATRDEPRLRLGASPRALRALVRCLQVQAAAQGRHYVVPSDVQRLAEPVLAHRLLLTREATLTGVTTSEIIGSVLASVPVPSPEAV
jgi:MoxR-like ATPase